MSWQDLCYLCVRNLLRKKTRTFLTVLGVLIGCCSIIIMVSLGIGMRNAQQAILEEMGDLTIITVTLPQTNWDALRLDEDLLDQLQGMEGVRAVTPKLTLEVESASLSAGEDRRYIAPWTYVVGLDVQAMDAMGYEFIQGSAPTQAGQAVVGQYLAYNLQDTTLPEGENTIDRFGGVWDDDGHQLQAPQPYLDPLEEPCTLELETSAGLLCVPLQPVGVVKADYNKGRETAEGIILPLDEVRHILSQVHGGGRADFRYDCILVKASSVSRVAEVERKIRAMGYLTDSMESVRRPLEKEMQQKQVMLGSLGAISLLVAALGIANTMIMSISERTREIGIMKSLGCPLSHIRMLFLMEAGAIGLLGGILGSIVSVLVSVALNWTLTGSSLAHLLPAPLGQAEVGCVSVIPIWLLVFAVAFSVLIGLCSGLYPANKAARIPALEAIKSE